MIDHSLINQHLEVVLLGDRLSLFLPIYRVLAKRPRRARTSAADFVASVFVYLQLLADDPF